MKQDKRRGVVIMDKIFKIYRERYDFTINKTVPETKLGPYKINRGNGLTYGKKN